MRRSCGPVGIALLAMVSALTASAQEVPPEEDYVLRVAYRFWLPGLDSEVQKGSRGEAGTLLDGEKDLGLGDERTFSVTAGLQIKAGQKIRGSYTRVDYSGELQARKTFRFGNTIFNRFTRVVTSVKGNYFTGDYQFDLARGPRGQFGALVGAKVFDVDYLIVAPDQGDRELDTVRVPIPVLGVTGRVYTGRLSFAGELSGITIGKRGSVWELDMAARLHVSDRLAVEGGYHYLSLRAEDKPDLVEFKQGGWNFGIELSL